MSIVNLGKIGINTIDTPHVQANTYNRLDVIQDSTTSVWYIAHSFNVPSNIPLTDTSYWSVFFDGVADGAQIQQNTADIAVLETAKADVHEHPYVLNTLVSTANANLTIAKRNSVGDINARLFRSEYTGGSNNSNYICVQHEIGTGDNYIRPRSITQVRSDLGIRTFTAQKRGAFGNARTHYIYPPTGYTMSHLTACSVWTSILHMNSSTLNTNLDVIYESTRIKINTHDYIYGVGYYTAWEKA